MIETPHSRDNALVFFSTYTQHNADKLKGRIVVDLSAGCGYIAHLFEEAGAVVVPYDLFPENNTFTKAACRPIDLQKTFPIESNSADYVILSETIEHIPDHVFLFTEVARIIKPGGIFLLTTPNSSSLRSRFSQFVTESEHYGTPPPNEITAFVSWNEGQRYYGKLFVSGVQRLRTLAAINDLKIKKVYPSQRSSNILYSPGILSLYLVLCGKKG
ncbi:MAG: class I SAM-dependent methyltransferase [Bacteroidota bacterium]